MKSIVSLLKALWEKKSQESLVVSDGSTLLKTGSPQGEPFLLPK